MPDCDHVLSTVVDWCSAIKSTEPIDVEIKFTFRVNIQMLDASSDLTNIINYLGLDPNGVIFSILEAQLNIAANLYVDRPIKHKILHSLFN